MAREIPVAWHYRIICRPSVYSPQSRGRATFRTFVFRQGIEKHSLFVMRSRIEQALRELPLSEDEISRTVSRFADNWLLRKGRIVNSDSAFFDFRGKINALVAYFAPDGLTLDAYLHAAVRQPQLFSQTATTSIANIEGVAGHFRDHGLTISAYLQAAVKQPPLFCQSPATVKGQKMADVVRELLEKHFG
jgi:hypothetical protein